MKWKASTSRAVKFYMPLHMELWEMHVNYVETALRFAHDSLKQHRLKWKIPPGPGSRHYVRPHYLSHYRVDRRLSVAVHMLERELRYRSSPEYRGFSKAVRDKPKDNTAKLVFADYCDEQGYHVMARRLRLLATTAQPLTQSKKRRRK